MTSWFSKNTWTRRPNPFSLSTNSQLNHDTEQAKSKLKVIPHPPDSYFSLNPDMNSLPTIESQTTDNSPITTISNPPETKPTTGLIPNQLPHNLPQSKQVESSGKSSHQTNKDSKASGKTAKKAKKSKSKGRTKKNKRKSNASTTPPNAFSFLFTPQCNLFTSQVNHSRLIEKVMDELFDESEIIISEVFQCEMQEDELEQFNSLLYEIVENYMNSKLSGCGTNQLMGQFSQAGNQSGGFAPYFPSMLPLYPQFMNQ